MPVRSIDAAVDEPRAPLAASPVPNSNETRELARAVDMLTDVVRRLDGHLDRLLEFQARIQVPAPAAETVAASNKAPERIALDRMTLERELDLVLAEIARVRIESRGPHANVLGQERSTLEDSARAQLGQLRRRQASVLARLLEFDQEEDAALDLRLMRSPPRDGAQ